MSEFEHKKVTPWGYIIDTEALPNFINESDFSQYTNGRFTGDRRVPVNIASATTAIRNYCGWHISPNATCGALFNVRDLRDAFVGPDLLIQLPATFVTSIEKVIINPKLNEQTQEYEGEELTEWDSEGNGILKVYDVGCRDRKTQIFIKYTAGYSDTDISDLKELTANRVTHAVTNTYGVNSEAAGGVSISYNSTWTGSGSSTTLTDDTRELLGRYKVKGVF